MMKWGDAKVTLSQAQREGVSTLGELRAWLTGSPKDQPADPPAADEDERLQAFLEQIKRDFAER